jgi:hypothetical protein
MKKQTNAGIICIIISLHYYFEFMSHWIGLGWIGLDWVGLWSWLVGCLGLG